MPDMLVRLYDLPDHSALLARVRADGTDIRPAIAPEKHLVVRWVRETFSAAWASECEKAFANTPVTCYIAVHDCTCVGFACYEATCRDFFGPVGVAEQIRGRGIGTALTWCCMRALEDMGYGYAIVGGAGPVDFYRRTLGAEVIEGSTPGIYRGMLREKAGG